MSGGFASAPTPWQWSALAVAALITAVHLWWTTGTPALRLQTDGTNAAFKKNSQESTLESPIKHATVDTQHAYDLRLFR
jgi:hypothetical protein